MLSLITSTNQLIVSPLFVRDLNFPAISSLASLVSPRRSLLPRRRGPEAACFQLVTAKQSGSLRFLDWRRRRYGSSWCCWCKDWESEGDLALEAEILEFMENSKKPAVFPTKKELVDGGRMDLVEAIVTRGGWLSLGWDSDGDYDEDKVQEARNWDGGVFDGVNIGEFNQRVESCQESNSFDRAEDGSFEFSSASVNCSESASPSGSSLELGIDEDTGIEGILGRLEKQRNLVFGINLAKRGDSTHISSRNDEGDLHFDAHTDAGGKLSHNRNVSDCDGSKNSLKPEMWRTWSIQRAGFSNVEFEAGEISFDENQMGVEKDASEALDGRKNIDHSHIRTRIQHMELELASALRLLQSKSEELISKEGHGSSSNNLRKLSDAWEFQETEIMNGQDRLRSIRAKLAVLEGKMALAIIDAQRMVEEKQKRVDGARRALQLLRTTFIVWPNSGSEVLLTGSFDGWTTQRKMEKSSKGIFSVCLKLYPGRYEIKFIVDGTWKTDPLRPVVRNNGYENNLVVVT
ncbi:protein PTST homolog 2, chloroplastic [Cornus florida]|uniref:protein PTST homolog 2, chloroplastic n=1 Tax=Cornus florida TaxID=4283 RepID=UPI002899F880|nr:protein PTST homolog 2, chloroplastic [Cornus florida]